MANNAGNWIQQTCTTVGTGALFLDETVSGAASFAMAVPSGPVWYSILDHSTGNREAGIGTFNGADSIARTVIHTTLSNGVYDNISPAPIDLSGDSLIACTINAEAFNAKFSPAALDVTYDPVNDTVADTLNMQDAMVQHARTIESNEPSMTGLYSGGEISGIAGTSVFSVTAGKGVIYNSYSDPGDTALLEVSWSDFIDIPIDPSGTSFGDIHIFVNSLGQVIQLASKIPSSMLRDYIFLGNVYFDASGIIEVAPAPAVIKQVSSHVYDSMFFAVRVSGAEIRWIDNELQIWNRGGTLFFPNVNWVNDPKNPNIIELAQLGDPVTPASMDLVTQTGLVVGNVIDIPQVYNPTGDTLTALVGLKATIHRLYTMGIGANRKLVLMYGQNQYSDASEAIRQLPLDLDNTTVPDEIQAIHLVGHICVGGNASDFSDSASAWVASINQVVGSNTTVPTAAVGLSYDNTASGMAATEVQGAIDEVDARTDVLESGLDGKVEEAPTDGKDYVRRNATWAVATHSGSTTVEYVYKTAFGSTPNEGSIQRDAEPVNLLYCHTLDASGVDVANLFESAGIGDLILFQVKDNAATRGTYEITGLITRTLDVHTIPVALVSAAPTTPPDNNDSVLFILDRATNTALESLATADDYRANVPDKILSTDKVWAAFAEVALTDAVNISLDLGTGFDFSITLTGNRTLANPTNVQVGQRGRIRVIQDATGGRTLAFGANFVFVKKTAPVMTVTANAEDVLFYDVLTATKILVTFGEDIG